MQTGCNKPLLNLNSSILIYLIVLLISGCGTAADDSSSNDSLLAVNSADKISVKVTSNRATVDYNGDISLDWSASDADSCIASGDWSGEKGTTGSEIIRSLKKDSSFVLTCSNATDSATSILEVAVTPPTPPGVSLSANPVNVVIGGSTTLSWTSTDATSCTASGNWSGSRSTNGTNTRNNLTSDKTYGLTCSGPGGNASVSIDVTVVAPTAPIVNLSATPANVAYNGSTTLSWNTGNVDSCTASGAWSGSRAISGSTNRSNLTSTRTYTLTCDGTNGSASDSVTVGVGAPPVPSVSLSASPSSVSNGGSTTLRWNSDNVDTCTASGGWSGSKNTSGSSSQDALTEDKTYTLSCTGAFGSASDSASVTVSAEGPLPGRLIQMSELQYRGAFRLSNDTFGGSTADYATGTLAYNPDNHSLFIAGHVNDGAVGEFPIPELLDRPTLSELNIALTPVQNFRRVLNTVSNPEGINRITGLLYVNGQLIINAEEWYDAGASNRDTTLVVRNAANLAASQINGYYELTGGANAGGYMSPIPPEWQAALGGAFLTGWSTVYSITSRYSIGPSLFVFDTDTLLNGSTSSGPVDARAFMNFPFGGGNWLDPDYDQPSQGSASPIWNFLSAGLFGFIVPGTSTFAVVGTNGGVDSGIGYKITQDNGNLCDGFCSYAAADNYNYYWLFDVREILNAANVYDIQPYAYGKMSVPFDNNGNHQITGATFDPGTGMLYLALAYAGGTSQSDATPLIVGYQVPIN